MIWCFSCTYLLGAARFMQAFTVATKHTQKAYFEKTLYMYAALPDELFTRYGALCQRNGQRNVKT